MVGRLPPGASPFLVGGVVLLGFCRGGCRGLSLSSVGGSVFLGRWRPPSVPAVRPWGRSGGLRALRLGGTPRGWATLCFGASPARGPSPRAGPDAAPALVFLRLGGPACFPLARPCRCPSRALRHPRTWPCFGARAAGAPRSPSGSSAGWARAVFAPFPPRPPWGGGRWGGVLSARFRS